MLGIAGSLGGKISYTIRMYKRSEYERILHCLIWLLYGSIPQVSSTGRHRSDTRPGVVSPTDGTVSLNGIPQLSGRERHGCCTSLGVDSPMDDTVSSSDR